MKTDKNFMTRKSAKNTPSPHLIALFRLSLGIVFFFALASNLLAATYYLDANNGNDNNLGAINAPWKTIAKAQSIMQAGDTFILNDGVYGDIVFDENTNNYGTSWTNPIIFKSANPHGARFYSLYLTTSETESSTAMNRYLIFDGIHTKPLETDRIEACVKIHRGVGYVKLTNLLVESYHVPGDTNLNNLATYGIYVKRHDDPISPLRPHHITIENCEVREATRGIELEACNYIDVINNHVHDIGGSFMRTSGTTYVVFDGNYIHTQHPTWWISPDGSDQIHGSGFSMHSNLTTIRNNIIHDCGNTRPIRWYQAVNPEYGYHDLLIENNIVYNPMNTIMEIVDAGENIVIRNNTFAGGRPTGVNALNWTHGGAFAIKSPINPPVQKVQIYNNILDGMVSYYDNDIIDDHHNIIWSVWPGSAGPTSLVLAPGSKMVNGYPENIVDTLMFLDYANKDFRLQKNSLAIGFADPQLFSADDILGNIRDNDPDVGAHEYGASAQTGTPVLNPIGNKSVLENDTITFLISATDPNGDTITYSAQNLPGGATFANQTFSWTPDTTQRGNYSVTFVATDGTLQDSETITITVNNNPTIGNITYYVDPVNGLDNNNGSSSTPWASLDQAKASVAAGNTVILRSGNYGPVVFSTSDNYGSSWSIPITYRADTSATPVFESLTFNASATPHYIEIDGISINYSGINTAVSLQSQVKNLRLKNLTITGNFAFSENNQESGISNKGIHFVSGTGSFDDILVENCEITQFVWGIEMNGNMGTDIIIRQNHVHHIAGSGIRISAATGNPNIIFDGNHIHNQIPVLSSQTSGITHGTGISIRNDNLTVTNNIIHNFGNTRGIRTYQLIFPTNGYQNMLFENNLVYDTLNDFAVEFVDAGNNFIIRNNTFIGHHGETTGYLGGRYYTWALWLSSTEPSTFAPDGSGVSLLNNVLVGAVSADEVRFYNHIKRRNIMFSLELGYGRIDNGWPGNWITDIGTENIIVQGNSGHNPYFDGSNNFFLGGSEFETVGYSFVNNQPHGQNLHDLANGTSAFQLVSGSPAIGYAYSVNASTTDITGTMRDVNPDAGAYEYEAPAQQGAPVLNPIGNQVVTESSLLAFTVSATDPDGDTVTYSAQNLPTGATFVSQTFSWTPTAADLGSYSVTFTASDGTSQDSETMTITVSSSTPTNQNPDAVNDTISTTRNNAVTTGNVLANDTDPDGDTLSITSFTSTGNGTIANNGNGTFTYTPNVNFTGTDTFTYTISDGNSGTATATVTITVNSEPPTPDLVLYMELTNDNPTDGVNDSSTYNNDGTVNGNVSLTTDRYGNANSAYNFDGSGDLVSIPHSSSFDMDTVTVAAWIYQNEAGDDRVVCKASGTNIADHIFSLGVVKTTVNQSVVRARLTTNAGSYSFDSTTTFSTNTWTHLAFTYDGQNIYIFVNGIESGVFNATGLLQKTGIPVVIGNVNLINNRYFNGAIDDVRIYNVALSANEISSLASTKGSSPTNSPPAFDTIGNQSTYENTTLTFSVSASDSDGDSITYSAQNLPSGALFANQAFTWTPTYTQAGDNYQVTFIASDATDQAAETINITVGNVNRSPILTSISDLKTTTNTPLNFTVSASDPDSDTITYSAQNIPAGATFTNQVFSWTPDTTANETNTITFVASDGQDQDFQTITIIVGNINQPPVLDPIGDQTIDELSSLTLTLNATDADGDMLSFSANNLPTGATLTGNLFSWNPTLKQAGIYQTTFSVTDNKETDFETVVITVNNINQIPVINTIDPITQLESIPVSFIVSATDSDEDVLTYSTEGLDLLTDATFENQTFHWTPGFESAGNYLITFNVSDGQDTVSQKVAITILNENRPPVFIPIGDKVIKIGDTLTFEISAGDLDGDPITYSALSLPSEKASLIPTANGAIFSWQTQPHELGTHSVTFFASDGDDMVPETIIISVVEGNLKPTFVPLDTQTVQENGDIIFTVSATDGNNDTLTYSAQNLPTGASFVGQTFTWTPDFNAAGEYALTFIASDSLLEDFMTISLIVQNTNRPPAFQPVNDIIANDTEQIQLDLPAADPDGDTLTYSVQGVLPGSSTLTASTFSWTLQYGDSGSYPITFVASDGDLETTATTTITVNHVNQPPTINVIADQFVNQYSTLTFPITVSDLENDPVEVTIQNLPNGAGYTNDLINWTPGDGQNGTTKISVEASDGQLTASTTVTIFVMNVTLDTTPPLVSYTSPADQAIQVPLNTLMVMEVADSGDGIDANTVAIQADGQDIYRGNVTEYNSSLGKMRRYGNPAIYKYTFQPNQMFRNDQKIELVLNAKDRKGNVMPAHTFSFSTEMMTFGGISPVNIPNDGQPQSHPISTRDAQGNLWAAWQSQSAPAGRIIVTRLLAGQTTFENAVQLPAAGDQAKPAIATDSSGKAYLCWQEQRQGIWNIYAAASTDGINWSTPLQLAPSGENQSNPAIAANPLAPGSVYIAYQQETSNVQDIHLVSSSNALGSVSLTAITNLSTQQINPDIVVANSTAYVVWTDLRHPTTSIYGASSANGWINIPIVNQSSNQSQPALAAEDSGNTLHLAWTDDQSGNQDIFYASSNSGFADAPLTGVSLIDDTTNRHQYNARLTTTGYGSEARVFVGWQDERNSPVDSDIYFVDLSAASRTNILVTTDTSKTSQSDPVLGVNAFGDPYLLWVDARGPDDDIYYGGVTNIAGVQMAAADVNQQDGGVVGTSFENITSTDDVSVEVPAAALWSDVTLTISKISNPTQTADISSILSAYEFSPSSELEFAKPVTITIPYEVADNQSTDVYWYNSLTGELSQSGMSGIEAIQISSNLWAIRFQTTHFSQYVVGQQPSEKTKEKGVGNRPKK